MKLDCLFRKLLTAKNVTDYETNCNLHNNCICIIESVCSRQGRSASGL
jgi:hypothetical protein